jgi:hypothetical protein
MITPIFNSNHIITIAMPFNAYMERNYFQSHINTCLPVIPYYTGKYCRLYMDRVGYTANYNVITIIPTYRWTFRIIYLILGLHNQFHCPCIA